MTVLLLNINKFNVCYRELLKIKFKFILVHIERNIILSFKWELIKYYGYFISYQFLVRYFITYR